MKPFSCLDKAILGRLTAYILVSIFILSTIGFLALESLLRYEVRKAAKNDIDLWRATIYSDYVRRRPNSTLGFRLFGINAEPLVTAEVKRNNLGLISRHDYAVKKQPGEFRIVAIGGEQTASSVANISWPDALQDELNRRFPNKTFQVLNFAWPDAGPELYIEYWQKEVNQYAPDLVLVNYPETDFFRTAIGAKLTFRGKDLEFSKPYQKVIDGQVFQMLVAVTKDNQEPISLTNPNVIASRPYGVFPETPHVFIPIEVLNNRQQINKLQSEIVQEQIEGALPTFGMLLLRWLTSPKQKLLPRVSELRNFDTPPATVQDEERLVAFGLKQFGWIQRNIPNVLLMHTFHAGEIESDFHLSRKMSELDPAIRVVDMRNYVPKNLSKEDIATWYMVPHMGEKFSDKGHVAYAKLVADMLCDKHKLPVAVCDGKDSRR